MTVYSLYPDVAKNPIFLGAPIPSVNRILSEETLFVREFSPREEIYSSQTGRLLVGILCSGNAHVLAGHAEEHTVLNSLSQGGMFGVANLFDEQSPFPTKILSVDHTKVLFIEGDAFRRCVLEIPTVLSNYLAFQSRKLMYLNRKLLTFTAGSAEKRLTLFLLEHRVGKEVLLPCSMSELAERLGIGRASLYRAVDALLREDLLRRHDHGFWLPDPAALEGRYGSPLLNHE